MNQISHSSQHQPKQWPIATAIFGLSTLLYVITLAPTTSLWDCGEFISCAVRLEVGHPPGAPLFLLLVRLFSLFAPSPDKVAFCCNLVSAICSGATVALLYLITHNLISRTIRTSALTAIVASAIAALTFAVTDTFWFSAVESEVYAMSIFFTALTLWIVLKWAGLFESTGRSDTRWLMLACYAIGLSVGVHLLNLLLIPVLTLIVWRACGRRGFVETLKAIAVGALVLIVILFAFVYHGLEIAMLLELFLVNTCGAPVHSGLISFCVILFASLFAATFMTRRRADIWHFVIAGTLLLAIGYTSYAMVIVRANAKPDINLNDPSQVFAFHSFINREQYGDRPLFYGPYYNSTPSGINTRRSYRLEGDRYRPFDKILSYKYDDDQCGFFPRLYSEDSYHKYGYSLWTDIDPESSEKPSFAENVKFAMRYQLGFMYMRYFLWNFAGRQNDNQGSGGTIDGNWICGIKFIDDFHLSMRNGVHPAESGSKARNCYYLLPLIAGIAGLMRLAAGKGRSHHALTVIVLLFVMTGPAIALYLNQPPMEPRERDYAYVGSFFAFCIAIGFGVATAINLSRTKTTKLLTAALAVAALPGLMLSQNFDDHDRSNRFFDLRIAQSYLESCEPDAILFTRGDNDTYPLWYAQQVEGIRTDVRVVNYGLMGADWCIRQLAAATQASAPVDFSISTDRYTEGNLDNALITNDYSEYVGLRDFVSFVGSNNPGSKLTLANGQKIDYSPTPNLWFDSPDGDTIFFSIGNEVLYKNDIALLDIIATNRWKRPIYFTVGGEEPAVAMGLDGYLQNEGLVLKLVPSVETDTSRLADILFDRFMNRIRLGDADTYHQDYFVRRTILTVSYRHLANRTASMLIGLGRTGDAQRVLEKSLSELPLDAIEPDSDSFETIRLMAKAGLADKAQRLAERHVGTLLEELAFFVDNIGNNPDEAAYGIESLKPAGLHAEKVMNEIGCADMAERIAQFNSICNFHAD